jgi:DNA mismatch endonuclease, patch repair protein
MANGQGSKWKDVPALRSAIMRANRRRDSKPELAVRAALHAMGFRFRVDLPISVPGHRPIRPDIVFTRRKVAVFVDGCFWHGCPQHGTQPKANAGYWSVKISENRDRDRRNTEDLERLGWRVVRIWEHEPPEHAARQVAKLVQLAR